METTIGIATRDDAATILGLQKLAYESEARLYNDWSIPPLTQTLDALMAECAQSTVFKAMIGHDIVGSVRAKRSGGTCEIGRLIVHPQLQRRGIGSQLLRYAEQQFSDASRFELFTGSRSEANIRLYERHGYAVFKTLRLSDTVTLVFMEKQNRQAR